MNETLDVIARRFACRAFTDQPVPHDLLRQVAEAGLHAPSAFNRQPWRLVIVDDKSTVDSLGEVGLALLRANDQASYERIMGRGGLLMYNAPAMIVIAQDPIPGMLGSDLDVGVLASHLALAATALGLNCCIAGLPAIAFQGSDGEGRAREMGIPDGFVCSLVLLLGYGVDPNGTPHEIDLAKIIDPAK